MEVCILILTEGPDMVASAYSPPVRAPSLFVEKASLQSDTPHSKFTAKLPDNVYNCKVGVTPLVKGQAIIGYAMVNWGTFIMGYIFENVSQKIRPSGQVTMPPMITEPDLSSNVIFSVDKTTQALTVEIKVPPEYSALGVKYIHMQGVFNWDYSSLTGTATEYDMNGVQFEGKTYEWKGQIVYSAAAQGRLQQSRNASVLKQKSFSTVGKPMLTAPAPVQYPLHPDALADASRTEDLGLMELFTLTAPQQSEVHFLTFDLIKQIMFNQLPDNIRSDILGVAKPRRFCKQTKGIPCRSVRR